MFKFTYILIFSLGVMAMKVSTGFAKFAPPKVGEVLAHLGMSEEAGHVVAHGGGVDVVDVLYSTVILILAEARLVKLTDRFVSCHFCFLVLKFEFLFLYGNSVLLHVISSMHEIACGTFVSFWLLDR